MKLKNKKTGEIVEAESCNSTTGTIGIFFAEGRECDMVYNSLAELNEEWEDYEEPKERWFVGAGGEVMKANRGSDDKYTNKQMQSIGNYFETREEAEKVVEKLKAWKRLRDKGFAWQGWDESSLGYRTCIIGFQIPEDNWETDVVYDLDLLFGEEEE